MEVRRDLTTSLGDKVADQLDGFAFALQQEAAADSESTTQPGNSSQNTSAKTIRVSGNVPAESWCRLGTQVLPQLGNGTSVRIVIDISVNVDQLRAQRLQVNLPRILKELGLSDCLRLEC